MNKDVIARFVALGVVLLNTVLSLFGVNPLPFSEDEVYIIVSAILTCAVSIWTAWKNNSVTAPAKIGDKIMTAIKNGEVTLEAAEELLNTEKETLDKDE